MIRLYLLFLAVLLSSLSSTYAPDPKLNDTANAFLEYVNQPATDSYYYFVGFGAKSDPIVAGKAIAENNTALPNDQKLAIGTIPNPKCPLRRRSCINALFTNAKGPLPDNAELFLTRLETLTGFDDMHSAPSTLHSIPPDVPAFFHANRLVLLQAANDFTQGNKPKGIKRIYENIDRLCHFLTLVDQPITKRIVLVAVNENLNVLSEMAIRTNDPTLFPALAGLTPDKQNINNVIATEFGYVISVLNEDFRNKPTVNTIEGGLKTALYGHADTLNAIADGWQPLLGLSKTDNAHLSETIEQILQKPASTLHKPNNTIGSILSQYIDNSYRDFLAGEIIRLYLLDVKMTLFNAVYVDQNPTPANPFDPEQASIIKDGRLCAPIPEFPDLVGETIDLCLLLP